MKTQRTAFRHSKWLRNRSQVKPNLRPPPIPSRRRLNMSKWKRKQIGMWVSPLGLQRGDLKRDLEGNLEDKSKDKVDYHDVDKDKLDKDRAETDEGKESVKGEIESQIAWHMSFSGENVSVWFWAFEFRVYIGPLPSLVIRTPCSLKFGLRFGSSGRQSRSSEQWMSEGHSPNWYRWSWSRPVQVPLNCFGEKHLGPLRSCPGNSMFQGGVYGDPFPLYIRPGLGWNALCSLEVWVILCIFESSGAFEHGE